MSTHKSQHFSVVKRKKLTSKKTSLIPKPDRNRKKIIIEYYPANNYNRTLIIFIVCLEVLISLMAWLFL